MKAIKWIFKKVFSSEVKTDVPIEKVKLYQNDIDNQGKSSSYQPVLNKDNMVPTYKCVKGKWETCNPELEEINSIDCQHVSFYTQNIWFDASNSTERYSVIVQMIRESNADFICLQEVIGPMFNAVTLDSEIQKKYYVSGNNICGYGVLILSKLPAYFYEFKFEESLMGRSLLVAEVNINDRTFLVATSHLESMRSAPIRKSQMEIAEGILKDYDSVFMGDFNFQFDWEEEKDTLNREIFVDLWESLIDEKEEKYTMPSNTKHNACVFDHIVLNKNSKYSCEYITRVGNFCCPRFSGEDPKDIKNDNIVRTPSDHLGLYGVIKVE